MTIPPTLSRRYVFFRNGSPGQNVATLVGGVLAIVLLACCIVGVFRGGWAERSWNWAWNNSEPSTAATVTKDAPNATTTVTAEPSPAPTPTPPTPSPAWTNYSPPPGVPIGDNIPDGSYKLTTTDYNAVCDMFYGTGSTHRRTPGSGTTDSGNLLSYELKCYGGRASSTGDPLGIGQYCRDRIGNGYLDAGNPVRLSNDEGQQPWYQWYCIRYRIP